MTSPEHRLGPFQVEARIARGGMGEIWRGRHADSGLPVAIKLVRGDRPDFAAALRDEIRTVAGLSHANIVEIYDQGTLSTPLGELSVGVPWLAMAWADCGAWADAPPERWATLLAALQSTLAALAHAHARGVLHLDIKPGNLLHHGGQTWLSDFGVALVRGREGGGTHSARGTPAFMAPEQHEGRWRDFAPGTDLYGLGCATYALVEGRTPFHGDRPSQAAAHLGQPPPTLSQDPGLPPGFAEWVATLLGKTFEQRFASAAAALVALNALPDPASEVLKTSARAGVGETGTALEPASSPHPSSGLRQRAPSLPIPEGWGSQPPPDPFDPRRVAAGLGLYRLRESAPIGRLAEREQLWASLRAIAEGGARAVLVRGSSGTGKSFLARWLCQRAAELGCAAALVAPHHSSAGDALGLAVGRRLGLMDLPWPAALQRARGLVSEPTLAHMVAALASSDRRQRGDRLAALRSGLVAIGGGGPVILWLDDAQRGAASLEFALDLVRRSQDAPCPVLVVLTLQEEELAERPDIEDLVERLAGLPGSETLALGPMLAQELEQLIRERLHLEPTLAARAVVRADGNPLFAEQLVGGWVERDRLLPGPGGFTMTGDAPLPDSLATAWRARAERLYGLGPGAGEALELAATLGEAVNADEWAALCEALPAEASARVRGALLDGRLARVTPGGWTFIHGMLRETVLANARADGRWAALNARCAEALESRYGDSAPGERLGRHLLAAGQPDRAAGILLADAGRVLQQLGTRESLVLLSQVDRALDAAGVGTDDRRLDAAALRAQLFAIQGRPDEAERAIAFVLAASEPVSHARAVALRGRATALARSGRFEDAIAANQEAARIYEGLERPARAGVSWTDIGGYNTRLGRIEEARACFTQALTLLKDAPGANPWDVGAVHISLAQLDTDVAGDLDAAEAHLQLALPLFEGRLALRGAALNALARTMQFRGDTDRAVAFFRESARLLSATGFDNASIPRLNMARIQAEAGDFLAALAEAEPLAAELARRGRHLPLLAARLVELLAHAGLGDRPRFEATLTDFMERHAGKPIYQRAFGELLADCGGRALESGWPTLARTCWEAALAQHERLGRLEDRDDVQRQLDALA